MNKTTEQNPDGAEAWVPEAIAQQEEHIKRQSSCTGINGSHADHRPGLSHSWDTFAVTPKVRVEKCWRCRVTRTDADYQIVRAAVVLADAKRK